MRARSFWIVLVEFEQHAALLVASRTMLCSQKKAQTRAPCVTGWTRCRLLARDKE
jgi:hypothetical protein